MEDNTLLIVNIFLIGLCLSAIVVIVILIIQNSNMSEEMSIELSQIDKKCPDCPKCEVKCPENKECPACPKCPVMPEMPENGNTSKCPDCNKTCPQCQECPSVDDIVTGIYPGRNPKVVSGGKYFQVDAANTYDGLSTSNFYDKGYEFPQDKILQPDAPDMKTYNLGGEEQINNSIENEDINTSKSTKLPVISSPSDIPDSPLLKDTDTTGGTTGDTTSDTTSDTNGSPPTNFDGSYQKILPDNL